MPSARTVTTGAAPDDFFTVQRDMIYGIKHISIQNPTGNLVHAYIQDQATDQEGHTVTRIVFDAIIAANSGKEIPVDPDDYELFDEVAVGADLLPGPGVQADVIFDVAFKKKTGPEDMVAKMKS